MRMDVYTQRVALLLAAIIALSIAYVGPASAGESLHMSEGELQQLFPGEFHVVVNGGLEVDISARRDGSLFAKQASKSDSGRWEIRAGQLCVTFSKWLRSDTYCSDVTEDGGWYRASSLAFQRN